MVATVALFFEYEAVLTRAEHLARAEITAAEAEIALDVLAAVVEPVESHFLWWPRLADMLTQIAACSELFHTATGTAYAISWSMVTGKPGPSAASASAAGCVAVITRPRGTPSADKRSL